MRLIVLGLAIVAVALPASIAGAAEGGNLDTAFGAGTGKTVVDFEGDDVARDLAVQPDGKIVVVGDYGTGPTTSDILVTRFNGDGSTDPTFAGGKALQIDLGKEDRAYAVALQSDGKIVVAGVGQGNFIVLRVLPNGNLDSGFGDGGVVATDFGRTEDRAFGLAIQSDGKIVAAGRTSVLPGPRDFALARYNPNGSLDASFGNGGTVRTDFGGDDRGEDVAIGPDGKIVVVGEQITPANANAVARYNANGGLDASFDADGKVITDFGPTRDFPYGVVVQPDGKVVVSGETGGNFGVVRYGTDGQQDSGFAAGGRAITDAGGDDQGRDLALQANGKIVVVGPGGAAADFTFVRYRTDGSLDRSFGSGGIARADFGNRDDANAVTVQSDGKILAGGASITTGGDFAFARVLRGFCRVPNLVGTTLAAARASLAAAGCTLGSVGKAFSKKAKKGRIVSQRPRTGSQADEDGAVSVVVSRGRKR